MQPETPEWVKHAVFYQVFPDRFARSPRLQHSRGIQFKPWGTPPAEQGYQGGDLLGIVDKLDYLQDLGITALYLNPIFSAASNHRYNAYDYLQVDPLLGGNPALRELLDEAHNRGMRVVLDGVFNHCGRGFWAFHHILENGGNSPYLDWFHIQGWPLHPYPQKGQKTNYGTWWGEPSLPKFNTSNPGVRDYLLHVTKFWLEFGADGWRLDVPEEIKDDSFWREFRQVVKGVSAEKYIVGEIWHEARHWLQGDMFDAVMNYIQAKHVINFCGAASLNLSWKHPDVALGAENAEDFARGIQAMLGLYAWQINTAQMTMMDSHDTPRALWLMNGDKAALKLAVLAQMTLPGAPNVYYGSEIGLAAGGDPHCREAFPWHKPDSWDRDLHGHYKAAIRLRHQHPALRTGDIAFIYAAGQAVAYRRRLAAAELVVVLNAGKTPVEVLLPAYALGKPAYEFAWGGAGGLWPSAEGARLSLGAQQAAVLVGKEQVQ